MDASWAGTGTATRVAVRPPRPAEVHTLPEALRLRSARQPDTIAFTFLTEGAQPTQALTYRQLDQAAGRVATALRAAGLPGRDRDASSVVLLYPPGLDFVCGLLGCMYAGVPAAPVPVPHRLLGVERLRRTAEDAGARVVLTTAATRDGLLAGFGDSPLLAGLTLLAGDELPDPAADWRGPLPAPADVALLQYTSGSTGHPKGVMVTHANFMSNVRETDSLWPCTPGTAFVSWLPHFHDMGMLFGTVLPLWAGAPAYLMAPDAFIRRPLRWLEALSRFRGTHAAAPSFAYELCVREARRHGLPPGLDLSAWRVAGNGAEPVRWPVIEEFSRVFAPAGFRAEAMCPGYGLAENTLKATGSPENRRPVVLRLAAEALHEGRVEPATGPGVRQVELVGNGIPVGETTLRIVDPLTREPCPPGRVGEIWISGPCVAAGYRGREQESEETFRARLAGATAEGGTPDAPAGPRTFLRTGDLGFLHEGELFVTGRLKDVIVRKGRNFYPQDIELSAERADPGLRPNCAAAFSVDDGTCERLVVVVEADGRVLRETGVAALRERIRKAVFEGQRLDVEDVVVVRRGSVPKTSSGKVQRGACRARYLAAELALASDGGERP